MKNICKKELCTACEACENVCPQKCIRRHLNADGSYYMEIDLKSCINCNACNEVCPNIKPPKLSEPQKAYAAWAVDEVVHRQCASGGIASVMYQYAAQSGMMFSGVFLNEVFEAHYKLTDSTLEIDNFRNSKYTFSFMGEVYNEIKQALKEGKEVLFVGLPCQVAALKNYISRNKYKGELLTVDLVCHGTPPSNYLQEHIASLESRFRHSYEKCFFRDPRYKTNKFAFTLYEDNNEHCDSYKRFVDEDDLFQIGYHNALIYRNNCYICPYAQRRRSGDLTIGDYHGLGQLEPYTFEREQVSVILENTEVGAEWISQLKSSNIIVMHERPVAEPLKYEAQLNTPSVAPAERTSFIASYEQVKNYDFAAEKAFKKYVRRNRILKLLHVKEAKRFVSNILPICVKEQLKVIKMRM